MTDCHIHIERGPYTLDWIKRFTNTAVQRGLSEIWLLEHCYRFEEFVPMYDKVCTYSDYIDKWFHRKAGVLKLSDYLALIETARKQSWPVKIRFGLEVCYFPEQEELVRRVTAEKGLDFLVGSVHFVDGFAYDHRREHWDGVDVDRVYRGYFETSADLAVCGLFDGIAHPDCIKLFGHIPSFSLLGDYDRLAAALAKSNMYAEQNGGAFSRCPDTAGFGMDKALIEALKRHDVRILTASDAHCPEDVGIDIAALEACVMEAVL